MTRSGAEGPKCRTCGKPIVGCAITRHGGGWTHAHNNAERCPAPHRGFAQPPSLADLNTKVLADAERSRRRRGIQPRI